ncbi:MAG: response regulator transcription factor [Clostridia bacterium]
MKKILVCEDEQNIREFIVINLKRVGYTTVEACCGDEALEIYEKHGGDFDVVILDIMMPGKHDGLAVCKELRKKSTSLGIIMLTARTQEMDKVSGLMMGADDYVTKPFSPSELLARVDSLYRRVELATDKKDKFSHQVTSGDFTLDYKNRSFLKKDEVVELTQVEFQIMEYFFANPGVSLSRNSILKQVWGSSYTGEEKIVDVNVRRLRMKVEDEPSSPANIITVWGYGYRWEI